MRINPVLLEGLTVLSNKKSGKIMIAVYMIILSIIIVISPDSTGNILGSGFNPPDIFMFIIVSINIISSLFIVICYSFLIFQLENTENWFLHGNMTPLQIYSGKIFIITVFSFVLVLISVPLIVYASLNSEIPALITIFTGVFIFSVLFSFGQFWVLSGILFKYNKVLQTIIIWVYLFVYLIISAKIIPLYNPVLILSSIRTVPHTYFNLEIFLQKLQSILYINLFLFFTGAIIAHIVLPGKKQKK